MTNDNAASDREDLEREEEETSPEESFLKDVLPEPEPTDGPAPAA